MKEFQRNLDEWMKGKGWPYWTPHEIYARLGEEVGELGREINHLFGPKKKKPEESESSPEKEIGDILYTLACYANSNGIDLEEAAQASLEKVMKRDAERYNKS